MAETAVYSQPAFILHWRPYRETSLILDILTQDFGRFPLIAKGVRKSKSRTAGMLQPFLSLMISFIGKSELKTMTHVEPRQGTALLKGMGLYSGFYINELVRCFLHPHDPHPELFEHYTECLIGLAGADIEVSLRTFELNLLACVGYGLRLDFDDDNQPIVLDKQYAFDMERGFFATEKGRFSGRTLWALHCKQLVDPGVVNDAKILMRTIIDMFLQGRSLHSRAVVDKVLKLT